MSEWDNVKELGACIGLVMDDRTITKISCHPKNQDFLKVIKTSAVRVFKGKYPPDMVNMLVSIIFDSDISGCANEDGRNAIEQLSRDVFRTFTVRAGLKDDSVSFEGFNMLFQEFIERFRIALKGVMFTLGMRKEIINLENTGIKDCIDEFKELPCRKFGELSFGSICKMRPPTSLSIYVESLVKRYNKMVLPEEVSEKILDIMDKMANYPNYFKLMDTQRKFLEVRPILMAISELQLYPGSEREKTDLLTALSIMLFNIFPSPRLIRFISRFEPSRNNQFLLYEYNAILALNYLLMGDINKASEHNARAFEFAVDEEKRAYSCILSSCISISRHELKEAVDVLEGYYPMIKDRRIRSMMRFYMGIIYYENEDTSSALECFKEARTGIDDEIDLMNVCNNIGTCAMLRGDIKTAINAFEEVEELSRYMSSRASKFLRSVSLGHMGIIYLSMREFDMAMECYKKALRINKEIRNKKGIADQLGNIGLTYKSKQDYPTSLDYFKSMLNYSYSIDYLEGVLFAFSQIDQAMALQGRYEDAEAFRKDIIKKYPGIAKMLKKQVP